MLSAASVPLPPARRPTRHGALVGRRQHGALVRRCRCTHQLTIPRYEIPLDPAVHLTAAKPLMFVYWGPHIANAAQARSKLPEGWLGDYLVKFFPSEKPPGGGWIGMQRFEER